MTSRRNPFYSILFVCFTLVALLIPLIQRRGDVHRFYLESWGKEQFNWIVNQIRFKLGDVVFENGIITDSQWAIYTMEKSLEDYQKISTLTPEEIDSFIGRLRLLNSELEKIGIELIVVVTPDKNTIYPEYVSSYAPIKGEYSNLDVFMGSLEGSSDFAALDLRDALLREKQNRQIYYATDTHWNPYGAYVGYREIMRELSNTYPDLTVLSEEELKYQLSSIGSGDIYRSLGINLPAEEIFQLVPSGDTNIDWKIVANMEKISVNPDGELKVVFYHDSFGNYLYPLFSNTFRETYYVWTYNYRTDIEWISQYQPDVVVVEFNERYLKTHDAFVLMGE